MAVRLVPGGRPLFVCTGTHAAQGGKFEPNPYDRGGSKIAEVIPRSPFKKGSRRSPIFTAGKRITVSMIERCARGGRRVRSLMLTNVLRAM
jgi:hypothetical protein